MRYILFIKQECPFCVRAVDLLEKQGKEYDVVKFDADQRTLLEQMKTAYQWETVPMVFERQDNDIKFIGGYTDLVEYLGNG
mgnify:FL=1